MTKRLGFEIPALVDFPPETKTLVIGAIKLVLRRLRRDGLLREDVAYGDLLGDAAKLHEVISLFKANRAIADDVVLDTAGGPVRDDRKTLICGITLAQIERLLVFTCAKRLYASWDGWTGVRSSGAVVPEELKRVLGFDWQLPLLPLYQTAMSAEHFRALGDAVLALRTPQAVVAASNMDPGEIENLKLAAGDRFAEVLMVAPDAGALVARLKPEKFALFSEAAGDRLWEFLAGEPQVRGYLMGVVAERVRALGPSLPDLCLEAARVLTDLPSDRLALLLSSFREVFKDEAPRLLKDSGFAHDVLAPLVARILGAPPDSRDCTSHAHMVREWEALKPRIMVWMRVRIARS